jgi:hypothetical protein
MVLVRLLLNYFDHYHFKQYTMFDTDELLR